jgi:hypothetical protein
LKKGITLIAVLVGVLAVTSGAFAAKRYLITSSSQIKAGAVSLSDLSPAARKALRSVNGNGGAAGPQGPQGTAGQQGPQGNAGPGGALGKDGKDGVSGYEVRTWRYSKDVTNTDAGPGYPGVGSGAIATVACSPGKVALGGGYRFTDNGFNSPAVSDGSGVVSSFPGRMDWSTNTVKPNDNSGWIVQVNNKVSAADMTLYVICVNAN